MIGFNGGLIGANRVNRAVGANVGVWTLDEYIYPRRGYRYIRWTITARRSGSNTQVAEFNVRIGTTNIDMVVSTATSSPSAGSPPSDVTAVKDNNVNTKWFFSDALPVSAIFDMGVPTPFDGYRWFTANDDSARDPVSWTVSGSNDGTNYTTLHTITNNATTTSRLTEVGPFAF
jgi:alpha-L-fucosidase 2